MIAIRCMTSFVKEDVYIMLCARCKNENREDAEWCWKCGASFYTADGNKLNILRCEKCGNENLYAKEESSVAGFFSCIVFCIIAIVVGKNLNNAFGEVLFYMGIISGVCYICIGIKSMFTGTIPLNITCNICKNEWDTRREKG